MPSRRSATSVATGSGASRTLAIRFNAASSRSSGVTSSAIRLQPRAIQRAHKAPSRPNVKHVAALLTSKPSSSSRDLRSFQRASHARTGRQPAGDAALGTGRCRFRRPCLVARADHQVRNGAARHPGLRRCVRPRPGGDRATLPHHHPRRVPRLVRHRRTGCGCRLGPTRRPPRQSRPRRPGSSPAH